MSIKKILDQLDDFFDLSKRKQQKKRYKLQQIITDLEEKKIKLKMQLKKEGKKNSKDKKTYNLCKEFKVLTKMIKKANKQEHKLLSASTNKE